MDIYPASICPRNVHQGLKLNDCHRAEISTILYPLSLPRNPYGYRYALPLFSKGITLFHAHHTHFSHAITGDANSACWYYAVYYGVNDFTTFQQYLDWNTCLSDLGLVVNSTIGLWLRALCLLLPVGFSCWFYFYIFIYNETKAQQPRRTCTHPYDDAGTHAISRFQYKCNTLSQNPPMHPVVADEFGCWLSRYQNY
jgi:hypothetical protein